MLGALLAIVWLWTGTSSKLLRAFMKGILRR